MSVENIISKIHQDTKEKAEDIIKDAKKQAEHIKEQIKQEAKNEATQIKQDAQEEILQQQHIKIAQAHQDMKRKIMAAQEELIETCFSEALKKLQQLPDKQYEDIVEKLMRQGKKKLGNDCIVSTSKKQDKDIAKKLGLSTAGSFDASGGVILRSKNGTITLDNTFEGILRRKKDHIRIQIGKLLFSNK